MDFPSSKNNLPPFFLCALKQAKIKFSNEFEKVFFSFAFVLSILSPMIIELFFFWYKKKHLKFFQPTKRQIWTRERFLFSYFGMMTNQGRFFYTLSFFKTKKIVWITCLDLKWMKNFFVHIIFTMQIFLSLSLSIWLSYETCVRITEKFTLSLVFHTHKI